MRYGNPAAAFLWIVGLAIPFLGARLPSAFAQADSLADWTAKEKAGRFAQPLKPDYKVRFNGLSKALYSSAWENPAADPALFADFYEKRIFPDITDPKTRGDRDDVIAKLRTNFRSLRPGSPVFDKLTEITLDYMPKIVEDPKWHPAVRINAVLAIGEVKSPKALPVLLGMIRDPKLNRAFKVAAMADLVHLAELRVMADAEAAAPVVAMMVNAAGAKGKQQSDALRWMRGQAADILGAIGSTGNANAVPAALVVMLGDEELSLMQRGKAARALGRLAYQGDPPNAAAYFSALVGFGSDALADNLPVDARWVRTVARDLLEGLQPLLKQSSVPKAVNEARDAMDKLQKEASKTPQPTAEELKTAIAAAKAAMDAAGGKK
jgi:hypothetical protein